MHSTHSAMTRRRSKKHHKKMHKFGILDQLFFGLRSKIFLPMAGSPSQKYYSKEAVRERDKLENKCRKNIGQLLHISRTLAQICRMLALISRKLVSYSQTQHKRRLNNWKPRTRSYLKASPHISKKKNKQKRSPNYNRKASPNLQKGQPKFLEWLNQQKSSIECQEKH